MKGYYIFSILLAAVVAVLTFAVSIPVNLLGTSLFRAAASFAFFIIVMIGARFIFYRFEEKKEDGLEVEPHKGSHVDIQTPEDHLSYDDIFAPSDTASEHADDFKPMSAPKLSAEQLADVIRHQSLHSKE